MTDCFSAGLSAVLPPSRDILIVQSGFALPTAAMDSLADLSMLWTMQYCNLHGYQYRRYLVNRTEATSSLYKPELWSELLMEFQVVVAIDIGVVFQDLTISLEDMLTRWGFTTETLILQPFEAALEHNLVLGPDGQSGINLHIGFSVLRSAPKVIGLMSQWQQCLHDLNSCQVPGGLHLDEKALEKTLWTVYFKPQLSSLEWVGAPCNEANGHSNSLPLEHDNDGCNGTIVAHYKTSSPALLRHLQQLLWQVYVDDQPRPVKAYPSTSK